MPKDENGYYQISSVEDLSQITEFPEANFILTQDLDLAGKTIKQLCASVPFAGSFDGAGHRLLHFTSNTGGLFKEIQGSVRRLGIVGAVVTANFDKAGVLCDVASGSIEQCYTTGSIEGTSTMGGMVGLLQGTMTDCYSTADVKVTGGRYAGGLVGISARSSNSIIQNCYAMGAVTVVDNQSAGGITGYTYKDSTVKNCFALNASVTASNFAHRIAARTLNSEVATLENNFALQNMAVDKPAAAESRTEGWMGIDKTSEEAQRQSTYETDLGWDFTHTWVWSESTNRPVLKNCQ